MFAVEGVSGYERCGGVGVRIGYCGGGIGGVLRDEVW